MRASSNGLILMLLVTRIASYYFIIFNLNSDLCVCFFHILNRQSPQFENMQAKQVCATQRVFISGEAGIVPISAQSPRIPYKFRVQHAPTLLSPYRNPRLHHTPRTHPLS